MYFSFVKYRAELANTQSYSTSTVFLNDKKHISVFIRFISLAEFFPYTCVAFMFTFWF